MQYGADDNAGILGLLFIERTPVLLCLSTFSLKVDPQMTSAPFLPFPPPPQEKRRQRSRQVKCMATCCVVHGSPPSEQKGSLGKDYFMMYPIVDPQSDWTHDETGRNTDMNSSCILGDSLCILSSCRNTALPPQADWQSWPHCG